MLLLTSTSDLVQVITASAVTSVEVHADWMDNASGTITPGRTNTANITTATTTTVVGSPAASTQRNVRNLNIKNSDASLSTTVDVVHTDGTTAHSLVKVLLLSGEVLQLNETGMFLHYSSDGVLKSQTPIAIYNQSTAAQGAGFASDTYLTGSYCVFPVAPKVGTRYRLTFDVTKTAAGTATPIITLRTGTAGTTSDTSRGTLTFAAGTAAASTARFDVIVSFRSVGSGTSATIQANATCQNTGTTGVIGAASGCVNLSGASGFNSTTADLGIGASFNGGTSASMTVQLVAAELRNIY